MEIFTLAFLIILSISVVKHKEKIQDQEKRIDKIEHLDSLKNESPKLH